MLVTYIWLFLSFLSFCSADPDNKTSVITEDHSNVATNLCYGLKSSGVAEITVKNKTMKVTFLLCTFWC